MGILDRIKKIFNLSVTDPKAWNPSLWRFFGSDSLSGELVNEYTALNYSAVYNAVSLISGTVATLPLRLNRKQGSKTIIADNKSLHRVLHDQANQYMTATAFREVMMSHVLLWGNAYAEIIRNRMGDVLALWPITPDRVTIKMENSVLFYEVRVNTETIRLPRENVLHIAGLGFDGIQGYSVIAMARKSIGLGMAMETFGSTYFGNGTHPGMIVEHPGQLSPQASINLKNSLTETYSGLGKAHRLMLLEEGMKAQKITINPEDSQFLESRQFQIPEIARWFNLPPHKLKDLTKSSFSNIESEQISFVTDSILPWLVRLEQTFNMQLLTESEKTREKLYFKHVVEGLLRGDSASRAAFYAALFNIGVLSINEIREREDFDPIEGGDEHFVQLNMTTLKNAGKLPEPAKKEGDNSEVNEDEPVV